MRLTSWLIAMALSTPLWAEDIRKALEGAYGRAEQCARYKFLDGMLSNRGPGFQLFGPAGLKRDLTLERDRLQLLFSRATRIRFKTQILKISKTPAGAEADVSQSLVVEQVDPQTRGLFTIVLSTRAIDEWKKLPSGWKLISSSVHNQSSSRAGRIVESKHKYK